MKKKMVIAFAVGLLSIGGIAMAESSTEPPKGNNAAFAGMRQCDGVSANPCNLPCMGPRNRGRGYNMCEALNLTEKQLVSFREIKTKHFNESTTELKKLWQLQKELTDESLKKTTDREKIDAAVDAIGNQHKKLAHLESSFLKEVATVLTPEQIQTFLKMKGTSGHGSACRM
ncbi:MAG: periplasmic heavy metal sensor [Chlorobiaceae bacterium]